MNYLKSSGILFLLISLSAPQSSGQYLPENSTYWWMKTHDGVLHYVLELGNSPDPDSTFIVLHGGYGAEHSYLVDAFLPLSDKYRFVLYDQRGSLRAEAPDSTITFENFVRDLNHLRQQLELNKINIIAHSNGSNIALDYLSTHPQNVNNIVLIAPPLSFLHSDAFPQPLDNLVERYQMESGAFQSRISLEIEEEKKKLNLLDSEQLSDRELTKRRRIEYAGWHTTSPEKWPYVQNAFYNPKVMENLRQNVDSEAWRSRTLRKSKSYVNSDIPIKVIIGDSDFVDPKAIVWSEIINFSKKGQLTVINDAGHNAWIDKPMEFKDALKTFLDTAK